MAAPMHRARITSFSKFCKNTLKRWSSKAYVEELTRPVTKEELPMDPELSKVIERGELKPRHNPGIMRLKTVKIPIRLEKAVNVIVNKYGNKQILQDAEKLDFNLVTRQLPLETDEINKRRDKIMKRIMQADQVDLQAFSAEERESYIQSVNLKVQSELKKHFHWKQRHYNASQGMAYLLARLAQNYAVLLQILSEIWKRDPNYIPKTLYNYGSGTGSVIWATQNNEAWKKEMSGYYCVDPSIDMNTIARLLLQDGQEEQSMHVKGVYFRKFSPSPATNSYSTVISAYTLIENPSQSDRLKMVQSLWDMTEDYLILVEMGTYAGHKLIQEARDYILNISEEQSEKQTLVFSPCPHQMPCPKLKLSKKVPCAFVVDYKPLELVNEKENKRTEKYTYVVLKKTKSQEEVKPWPRLVSPSTFASKHVHCRICCPNGELDHIIISKGKHSKELYRVAKTLNLGDYLPAIYTEKSVKQNKKTKSDKPKYKMSTESSHSDNVDLDNKLSSEFISENVTSTSESMSECDTSNDSINDGLVFDSQSESNENKADMKDIEHVDIRTS